MKQISLLFFILSLTSFTSAYASDKVKITNAWINEAPPMAKALAGYLEIHNMSERSIMLRSIISDNFERSESHKTEIHEGVARMTPVSHIIVKPHSKISFEPGGLHLMLINPKKALKAGDEVSITLHFSNNEAITFNASVKKMSGMKDPSHNEMHHDMKNDDKHDMH